MKVWLLIFVAGLLFGLGLAVSGMTDPGRVTGFLDVAGDWDPALMFVMGGALGSFGLGMLILRKITGGRGVDGCDLPKGESDPISKPLLIGSAVFGLGWALGGFCPGPALANLAAGHTQALVFVPTMIVGMWLARRLAGADG
jgi:uncharacterized membrane protein YedE/YeeE